MGTEMIIQCLLVCFLAGLANGECVHDLSNNKLWITKLFFIKADKFSVSDNFGFYCK